MHVGNVVQFWSTNRAAPFNRTKSLLQMSHDASSPLAYCSHRWNVNFELSLKALTFEVLRKSENIRRSRDLVLDVVPGQRRLKYYPSVQHENGGRAILTNLKMSTRFVTVTQSTSKRLHSFRSHYRYPHVSGGRADE